MNRAMFSGVAGIKTHQTKMDVIGNNIANVNTFGFKSQRAVFSDIFYQTLSGASAGTANRGGTNPSSVGYGSRLAAVQTQMEQSSMQSTGYGMDVAITGEGFFQVMDPDGNIFYTKAGLFDYDANGYLTDVNGNFVLGSTNTDGAPDSKKIKLDNIGSVNPMAGSITTSINGIEYKVSASNTTSKSNASISLGASGELPLGQKVSASISSTGAISVLLNKSEKFANLAELNREINAAIKEANGGKEHPAGEFTISSLEADKKFAAATGGLTGEEICSTDFNVQSGSVVDKDGKSGDALKFFGGLVTVKSTSSDFLANPPTVNADNKYSFDSFGYTVNTGTAPAPDTMEIKMSVGNVEYTATIEKPTADQTEAKSIKLTSANNGSIVISNPGYAELEAVDPDGLNGMTIANTDITVFASTPSKALGLSSAAFNLEGGTSGGPVTLDELTSIAISSDGTISVTHPDKGTVAAGRISLANFANPSGLQLQGKNYYSETPNSGAAKLCDPGTDGTGGLVSNALEMSNVDLSAEFADMITTQRGFQANSRIITVSDTMLEELINLKR